MSGSFKTLVHLFSSPSLLVRLTRFIKLVDIKTHAVLENPSSVPHNNNNKKCLAQSHYLFPAIYYRRFLKQQNTIEQRFKIILIYFFYSLLQVVTWIMSAASTFDIYSVPKVGGSCWRNSVIPLHIINIVFIIIVM